MWQDLVAEPKLLKNQLLCDMTYDSVVMSFDNSRNSLWELWKQSEKYAYIASNPVQLHFRLLKMIVEAKDPGLLALNLIK